MCMHVCGCRSREFGVGFSIFFVLGFDFLNFVSGLNGVVDGLGYETPNAVDFCGSKVIELKP